MHTLTGRVCYEPSLGCCWCVMLAAGQSLCPMLLRAEDLDKAEEAVLYHVQSTHFEAELRSLAETGRVQSKEQVGSTAA